MTQDQIIEAAKTTSFGGSGSAENEHDRVYFFGELELFEFSELILASQAQSTPSQSVDELLVTAFNCADGVNEQGLVFEDTGLIKLYDKWQARTELASQAQPKTENDALIAAKDEIEMLRNLLVCITHHDNAINEYEAIWLPVVQAELARRIRDEA